MFHVILSLWRRIFAFQAIQILRFAQNDIRDKPEGFFYCQSVKPEPPGERRPAASAAEDAQTYRQLFAEEDGIVGGFMLLGEL